MIPRAEVWWRAFDGDTFHRLGEPSVQRTGVVHDRHQVATTLKGHDGQPLAYVVHDASLLDDQRFARAVSSAVALIADRQRLADQVQAQLAEVRASRTRILEAASAERARLERDLHDGSQQRLVGLALQLRMARSAVDSAQAPALAEALDIAAKELAEALADLRELARGIHPAALTDGGLHAALPLLAGRTPIPTSIEIDFVGRLDPIAESTLYFVAAESLTNVAKHAAADNARVTLEEHSGHAVLTVWDDGVGGADESVGTGLRGLRDRLETLNGSLHVASNPDTGTTLVARVPLGGAGDRHG